MIPHRFNCRVYYEDTDLAGIVYHANYLKFIERARTEWVRERGVDQIRLKEVANIVFAVRRLEADYIAAARFDDWLTVETRLVQLGGARIILDQVILRAGQRIFAARVTLVCIGDKGATRLPADIRQRLEADAES